jgi:hypothetical protein
MWIEDGKSNVGMVNTSQNHLHNLACIGLVLRFSGPCPAEYCERYAKAEDMGNCPEEDSSDGDMSDGEHTSSDEEMAGHADP